jgi:hypothetical protein
VDKGTAKYSHTSKEDQFMKGLVLYGGGPLLMSLAQHIIGLKYYVTMVTSQRYHAAVNHDELEVIKNSGGYFIAETLGEVNEVIKPFRGDE